MDNVTLVRIAAAVIAVVLLAIVITRRKRMTSGKRMTPKK
jgi:hypothetical protein